MKKVALALAGLALTASAFAEGFKLNGVVRSGWYLAQDDLVNGDEKNEKHTASANVDKFLIGDKFGGTTRTRLNFSWASEGDTAGAYVRFNADKADYSDLGIGTAYAWIKAFDGKFLMQAGSQEDNYIGTPGKEGFCVMSGKGFFAGVAPIEGLVIGGGAQTDWLDPSKTTTESKLAASKEGIYFGAKYTNKDVNNLAVSAGYSLAGKLNAGVSVDPIEKLNVALEWENQSKDFLDENFSDGKNVGAENTFVESVEYTGVENLTVGLYAYEWLNDRELSTTKDSSNIKVVPYARYEINDALAASLEADLYFKSVDGDKVDTAHIIVPAFYVKAAKGAEANVFAAISTDKDITPHKFGTGHKFEF